MIPALLSALAMAEDHGYDAWPLRRDLSDLSFARTEEGRAAHRFAGKDINRYRLYATPGAEGVSLATSASTLDSSRAAGQTPREGRCRS